MSGDTVEALAYAEALRAIEAQSGVLESVRSRAATVLSAAALVTAFLGGQALASPSLTNGRIERPPLTAWSWTAISSFAAVVILSLLVLFPYKWLNQVSATKIMRDAATVRATVTDVQRDLARYLDADRAKNQKLLWRLFVFLGGASALMLLEAIAWIVDLT
jgi:hypothetical protein